MVAGYNAAKTMADGEWGAGTAVVAPVGQVFETAGFADGLYANDKEMAGAQGRELAAMTLYYTIYGAFIADEVTYAQASAAGVTSLSESEWRQLAAYLRRTVTKGLAIIFR